MMYAYQPERMPQDISLSPLTLPRSTAGAFVNAQTLRGFTPLHFAYENHHYELISLLITNGADPNIKSRSKHSVPSLEDSVFCTRTHKLRL